MHHINFAHVNFNNRFDSDTGTKTSVHAQLSWPLRKKGISSKLFTLLFFFLTIASISSPALANNANAHKQAEVLTHSLIGLNTAYQQAGPNASANALEELLNVANERHALLSVLIEEDPGAVLRFAIPTQIRADMPEEVSAIIEQRLELEGDLEVLYEDYEDGSHRLRHFMRIYNERISLHFKTNSPALHNGMPVTANGVYLPGDTDIEGAMALESGDNILTLAVNGEGTEGTAGELNSIGEQSIAVILVNFQNNNNEPISMSSAHELVFNEADNFMQEASSGLNWLNGQVLGWYNLPIEETCVDIEISAAAQDAAIADGVDLSQYSRIIYMFPNNPSCGWSGLGTVGGATSETWINGSFDLRVVGHELGHNYGLHHAHSLECGTTTEGSSCTSHEYGDRFDIMGMDHAAHFNAFHKELLGWLSSDTLDILEVESSGQYTLEVFENDIGTRVLKIPKGLDSSGMQIWYYLEYRQAVGGDAFLQNYNNIINGVLVRTGTDQDIRSSYLYDMTPDSSLYLDWYDPALAVGYTYEDEQAGVMISVVALDGSSAQIEITLNSSDGGGSGGGNPPENQAPVAIDDVVNTAVNTTVSIPVLDNDYDPDDQAISVLTTSQPANGTVSIKADGSIDYKPRRKFTGIDTFIYEITDGTDTSSAFVTIDVQGSSGGGGGKGGGGKGGRKK